MNTINTRAQQIYNQLNTVEATTAITRDIALKLRDGLAHCQDGHSVESYNQVCKLIHDAGLSTCLIPYRQSVRSKQWDVKLAVVDRGLINAFGERRVAQDDEGVVLPTYALLTLQPMQLYVGDLGTCNLAKPWYVVNPIPLMRMLVPTPSRRSDKEGRGFRADENWQIFCEDFDALWQDGYEVKPSVQLNIKQLRFTSATIQPDHDRLNAAYITENH